MTKVGKILRDIAHLFDGIFKRQLTAAEKDYNSLTEEEQATLLHGAGIMKFISQQIGKTPAVIKQEISTEFPDIDEVNLEKGLYSVAHAFNLAPLENNIEDTIAKLQAHFNTLHGTVWDTILETATNVYSFIVAPAGGKLAAGINLAKYVYLTFFKK